MPSSLKLIKKHKNFGGYTCYYQHDSFFTNTKMNFSCFIPEEGKVESCLLYLSGLTCTEENFITKAGVQQHLAKSKTMVIAPDTSPRGTNLPGEHDSYDFGSGAGFYLNATTPGYKDHYQMYDYVTKEIIEIAQKEFHIKKFSIMGHSMGGHGALIMGLREKNLFKSVSAFAPISNPTQSASAQKAFSSYLGNDRGSWKIYDATELLLAGYQRDDTILISQGTEDEFLEKSLMPNNIENAAKKMKQQLELQYCKGYDHSYFFVSTFIKEHVLFHLKALV